MITLNCSHKPLSKDAVTRLTANLYGSLQAVKELNVFHDIECPYCDLISSIFFQLVNGDEEDVIAVREAFDWYIYPVVNVDRYEYTFTDVSYEFVHNFVRYTVFKYI